MHSAVIVFVVGSKKRRKGYLYSRRSKTTPHSSCPFPYLPRRTTLYCLYEKSETVARPMPDGGYELISGHRRLAACQVLGFETMPVIVREMSDDEAVIAMVDANLQRETILPSEKAFAYKMKLDALNHQGVTWTIVNKVDK